MCCKMCLQCVALWNLACEVCVHVPAAELSDLLGILEE